MSAAGFWRSKPGILLITLIVTLIVSGVVLFIQRSGQSGDPLSGVTGGDRPEGIPTPLDPDEFLRNLHLTRTPPPGPAHPARLQIKAVGIDVLVLTISINPDGFLSTPVRYAGYWGMSAPLGTAGNSVIVGHNRTEPRPIFLNLSRIKVGDEIVLTDQFDKQFHYAVDRTLTLKIEGVSTDEASRPAQYVQPTDHEQLTLMTCYPERACTDRLVVLALPAK